MASHLRFALPLTTVLAAVATIAGCGGKTDDETTTAMPSPSAPSAPPGSPTSPRNPSAPPPAPAAPAALYVPAGDGANEYCAKLTPSSEATATLTPQGTTAQLTVVAIKYADECTGAGGQYILARDVYAPFEKHFLGEHACYAWETPPNLAWGVLQYHPTSSQRTVSKDVCVAFDEQNAATGLVTASVVRGVGLFASRAEAEAYAKSIGWQQP